MANQEAFLKRFIDSADIWKRASDMVNSQRPADVSKNIEITNKLSDADLERLNNETSIEAKQVFLKSLTGKYANDGDALRQIIDYHKNLIKIIDKEIEQHDRSQKR